MKTKKIFKKGLSLFLALIMMLSIVPMTVITSFAATDDSGIQKRIDEIYADLQNHFPNMYWNVNDQNCSAPNTGHGCSNCSVYNIVKKVYGETWTTAQCGEAQSCRGFAFYVFVRLFGSTRTDAVDYYNVGPANSPSTYNKLVKGDYFITANHTMVYISHDSSGVLVLDANRNSDSKIRYEKISYSHGNMQGQVSYTHSKRWDSVNNANKTNYSAPSTSYGSSNEGWYRPVEAKHWKISDGYGWRNYESSPWHWGIDICGYGSIGGAPVRATKSGTVYQAGYNSSMGNYVFLNHNDGSASAYMHMKYSPSVKKGQSVRQGDTLGYVGSTGNSTGNHLDFRILTKTSAFDWYNGSANGAGHTINPLSVTYKDTLKIDPPKDAPKNLKATGGITYSDNKIAVDKTLNFSWSGVSGATQYVVKLNGSVVKSDLTSTSYSLALKSTGTNTIEVAGKNSAGTGPFAKFTCEAKAPITAYFYDDNGTLIEYKETDWNSKPTEPANVPIKEHYTFKGWVPSVGTAITENQDYVAQYEKVKYNVRFFAYNADGETVQIGSTQKVKYLESATAPANYESYIRSGMEFAGWSTDFSSIEGNTDVYLIEKWYNENMKIKILDGASAVRDPDGYTVNCTLQNNYEDKTVGRVIVAIKTAEGKLIYTTESAAFTIKAGQTKAMEIYVPCAEMGTVAEIYAVEKYTTALPISLSKHVVVDQGNAFSNWSTKAPPANAIATQTKTQYRYKDKEFKTSGYSSLTGYTQVSKKLISTSYGGWYPWSMSVSNSSDANYSYERSIETKTAYRYNMYYNSSTKNYFWYNASGVYYPRYLSVWAANNASTDGNDNGNYYVRTDKTLTKGRNATKLGEIYCIWDWPASDLNNGTQLSSFSANANIEIYKGGSSTLRRDVTKKYQYTHYKWGDWSEWSDDVITANDNRQVETQTLYRYKTNDTTNLENTDGTLRTISGNVDASLAGREADLFIYKYNEASDWTNQYIGQCTIGEDGSYSFTFKLRTEPSLTTGDYTATLGIEGTSAVIDLSSEYEWLKAPLPTHNVTYYNTDGSIISTQTVVDGQNAVAPNVIPEREGYTFIGWSESNINVTEDLIISPVMQINTYTVTFIDWENHKYEVRAFTYGDELTAPEIENIPEGYNASWDAFANDIHTVTENMVVCSVYEKQTFTVNFYDYNNELVSTQTVEYGEAAELPVLVTPVNITFVEWSTPDCYNVKDNLDVYPVFYYDKTVAAPTANYDTDIYDSNITVILNCETEGATIYYTVDGTNPVENGIEYTEPIAIEKSTALSFVAVKKESNNSKIIKKYYALNKADMTSEWMEYEALPEYVIGHETEYSVQINPNGYKYKDITSTDSISNVTKLNRLGWTEIGSTWSDWSEYSKDYPEFPDKEIEIRSKDGDLVEKTFYNYSHYKYYDVSTRTYKYAPSAVANTNGVTETLKVDEALTSFGGIVNGTYSFMHGGEQWFMASPFTTTEMVDPGYDVYSYRTKVYNLYKWSEWSVTPPSAGETREYETGVVFRYAVPKEFIVSIDFENSCVADKKANEQMLVMNGNTLNLAENYFDVEGYTLDGIYTDPQYANEWDIETDTVAANVTLYPKYTLNTFNVTFLDYDNSVISSQEISYLHYANIPDDPTRDGYVFITWECIEGTQSDGIVSDVTYIARYMAEEDYTRISLSRTRISIMTGSTAKLKITLSSVNATDSDVVWYSSNPEIATVDEYGNITGVHSGTAMITAITMDTYESANCVVTVLGTLDTEILPVAGSGVTVDPSAKYLLGIKAGCNSIESINGCLQNEGLIYTSPDGSVIFNELTRIMGTGCRIRLEDVEELIDEVILVVKGDVNGDGAVDAIDAIMVDLINNKITGVENEYAFASDVTGDGKIDSADYAILRATVMCNAG